MYLELVNAGLSKMAQNRAEVGPHGGSADPPMPPPQGAT